MKNRIVLGSAIGTVLGLVAVAATVTGAFAHSNGATPLPASSCTAIQNPSGNLLIASDLPLQGADRTQTEQMTKMIAFVFGQAGWKAGNYSLAYQSCDDSTAQAGKWDSGKASANANAYAEDASVAGVIGTFNSGAAEIEIPILNRAANGPLAMISPANTYVGLTTAGPGTAAGEPGKYYPTGKRNYARVVAADSYQGAADAMLAKGLGIKKVYVLNDQEAYGAGVASNFAAAARSLGITVASDTAWDGKATSYAALALKIKASGATGVFLGGLICENGTKLIKDIAAGDPGIHILAPDGFTPVSAVVQGAGTAANNMTVSVAGVPNNKLPASGQAFLKAFSKSIGGATVDPYTVYAAQAAQLMIAAIGMSDGTRAGVTKAVFKARVADGVLGKNFGVKPDGDVASGAVTVYRVVGGKQTTYKVITPPTSLVAVA